MGIKTKPTGVYARCKHWEKVLEAARLRPRLSAVVAMYDKTKHPGCLNAIMVNADDANLWLTYYTGRIIKQ